MCLIEGSLSQIDSKRFATNIKEKAERKEKAANGTELPALPDS